MHQLRLYAPLIGLSISIMLICDALAFKVVTLFGHDFAASGLIFPLGFVISSITTEVYGFTLAGRIIWIQMLCQALFILTVNFFVLLPSPPDSATTSTYLSLYHEFWHVLFASTTAVLTAYFINDIIMSKLKIYLSGKFFIIRFLLSNTISAAILVTISYPINFYGLCTADQIISIAINTWLFKILFAVILFPLAIFLQNLIKKIEKLDYFDYGISYNPLTVFKKYVSGENKYEDPIKMEGWYRENYTDN